MAYFEMILMVGAALTGLVLLALVASAGPVSHRHHSPAPSGRTSGRIPGRIPGPPARPWSRAQPMGTPPAVRTLSRRHGAARCTHHADDWARLMDTSGRPNPTVEAER